MATTYSDVITTSTLSDAIRTIYSDELETTAKPRLIYDQFVEVKTDFKVKKGQRVYWTVYHNLPPAITVLTENQDVDGGQLLDHQVDFTVDEYGYAIGTTEEIDELSYHGPILNIARSLLAPQMASTLDILARNAFIGGSYVTYGGTAVSRATLAAGDKITEDLIRAAAYNLSVRRVPLMRGGGYMAVVHPSVVYDIRGLSGWREANLYAGATNIFNGEVGQIHGIRFVEDDLARLPNAGAAITTETTLNDATVTAGDISLTVTSGTGFTAGMEVTIYPSTMSTPTGTNQLEEHAVISAVSTNLITFKQKLAMAHANGSKFREGLDVYPIIFIGDNKAVGKGVVVAPEVRVALPTDKLRRMNYVGWYFLGGYGIIRDDSVDRLEVCATKASAPGYPY